MTYKNWSIAEITLFISIVKEYKLSPDNDGWIYSLEKNKKQIEEIVKNEEKNELIKLKKLRAKMKDISLDNINMEKSIKFCKTLYGELVNNQEKRNVNVEEELNKGPDNKIIKELNKLVKNMKEDDGEDKEEEKEIIEELRSNINIIKLFLRTKQ